MADAIGYRLEEYLAREKARMAKQPLVSRCSLCEWTWEGTVEEGIKQAQKHREKKHPEMVERGAKARRSIRSLHSFRSLHMDAQSREEIEQERRKRAYVHGVEIQE